MPPNPITPWNKGGFSPPQTTPSIPEWLNPRMESLSWNELNDVFAELLFHGENFSNQRLVSNNNIYAKMCLP